MRNLCEIDSACLTRRRASVTALLMKCTTSHRKPTSDEKDVGIISYYYESSGTPYQYYQLSIVKVCAHTFSIMPYHRYYIDRGVTAIQEYFYVDVTINMHIQYTLDLKALYTRALDTFT